MPKHLVLEISGTEQKEVVFKLANASTADVQFLHDVIRLFVDPKYDQQLTHIRAGTMSIFYAPKTGTMRVSPVFGSS